MGRPSSIQTVLLDASCLIGYIKGDADMACLRALFAAVEAKSVTLVESSAILAEVLPQHAGDMSPEKRQQILELLESENVQLVDVSSVVASRAAEFRVQYRLKTWDAVHLATSIIAKVDVFMHRDGDFPMTGTVDGTYVSRPFDIDDDKLPFPA